MSTWNHLACWVLCVCVLASEMSIREDCPGQCSSQRATSGTLCFVLWSSTWILTGRRRCYWEHMARSQLLFTDAPSTLLTLLIIKAGITLDEEDGDSLLYILVCRNFFVTNSNQWGMTTMGSLSYSGGGASRVRCCLLYTWIWPGTVWESWLFLHWRDCISYRFVEQSFGSVVSGAEVCRHSSPLYS